MNKLVRFSASRDAQPNAGLFYYGRGTVSIWATAKRENLMWKKKSNTNPSKIHKNNFSNIVELFYRYEVFYCAMVPYTDLVRYKTINEYNEPCQFFGIDFIGALYFFLHYKYIAIFNLKRGIRLLEKKIVVILSYFLSGFLLTLLTEYEIL